MCAQGQVWSFRGPTQHKARGPLNPNPELQADKNTADNLF